MPHSWFVSDLHLFAARSHAEDFVHTIAAAAQGAKLFVLGGDIFDFHWSTHASVGHSVEAAVRWLEDLVRPAPHCQFHFLLGNHDYHQALIDRLGGLAARWHNFLWHPFYFRHGSNVFLHGDVAERKSTAAMLAGQRARWLHRHKRGPLMSRLYDLVVMTHVHRPLPYLVYRRATVAKRILAYLDDIGHGPEQGVRQVFFGHIHRPMANYRYGGLTFHCCGAGVKGHRLELIPIE